MKHKNYKAFGAAIRRVANTVLTQDDLAHQIIIKKGNKYQAYNDFTIEETPTCWQLSSTKFDAVLSFSTAKVALAWCILYKSNNHNTATLIQWLDSRISAKQADIDLLVQTLEDGGGDRPILMARLTEDINSRQCLKKQLAKCVDSAKYIKLKGTNR